MSSKKPAMTFDEYLATINEPENRKSLEEIVFWVRETYPQLELRIAWKQPMFTDHGTFIIGFSPAKNHLSIAPELATMEAFADTFKNEGIDHTKMFVRIPWSEPFNYDLLSRLIEHNITTKRDCTTFWRQK
ncbi:MAG: iron chaperone [Flaviflexus sp.]|nr:iron chaperone [Flaviflexus sp.]